jgi:predicted ATPase/DNA-binding SARP family transcriptional activator
LCGELRAQLDDADVAAHLPARQGRLLFAYLVLHRDRVVRRDELAGALWPARSPRDPDAALNALLARLRRVVGHARLPARAPIRLRLGEPAWVDVEVALAAPATGRRALEGGRLDHALELAEQAFAIIELPLLPEFERDWLEERRRQLHDLSAPLVDVVVDASLALGGRALQHAEQVARRAVAREPFRESVHEALMKVLVARGDMAEALRVFDALRVRLRDELGAAPSRPLLALHQRMLTEEAGSGPLGHRGTDIARAGREGGEPAVAHLEARSPVPSPPTPLLGRDEELERLRDLLMTPHVQLVSVVGPAGVGKTRLAVELALRAEEPPAWVALASLRAPVDVAPAIARALSVPPSSSEAVRALTRALEAQELDLLVLDNFEHVLSAATLVAELLEGTSRLKVLVTSREPLRLRAEHVFKVRPLELPSGVRDPAQLALSPSTALFVATATARDPDFTPSRDDATAIADICHRVDGLPLAIELAAGRLDQISAGELANLVRTGLDALTAAARDVPERQRTLRATLAWSHRLLTSEEQVIFARFAVFAGGADEDAARAVAQADIETLSSLVAKHLMVRTYDGARRLDMLETVRQFSRELFVERRDARQVGQRHAEYFLARAEKAAPELQRRAPSDLIRALDRELDNLRAAMSWMLDDGHPEQCIRLAAALSVYWYKLDPGEGARWLRAGLEAAGDRVPGLLRVTALNALSLHLAETRAGAEGEATARRALELARELGDVAAASVALVNLAFALIVQSRESEAYPVAVEAAEVAATTADPGLLANAHVARASCAPDSAAATASARRAVQYFEAVGNDGRLTDLYCNLTYLALVQGDDRAAIDYIAHARAAAERAGTDADLAPMLGNEGLVKLVTGDVDAAERAFRCQLRLAVQRSLDSETVEGLYGLAAVLAGRGEDDVAARVHGAASAFADELVHPAIRARLDELFFASSRRALGEARWRQLVAAGRRLTPPNVLALIGDRA